MSASRNERDDLARRAAEAGNVAAQAVGDYGLGTPEAGSALAAAERLSNEAVAAEITPDEIKAARRAFGPGRPGAH